MKFPFARFSGLAASGCLVASVAACTVDDGQSHETSDSSVTITPEADAAVLPGSDGGPSDASATELDGGPSDASAPGLDGGETTMDAGQLAEASAGDAGDTGEDGGPDGSMDAGPSEPVEDASVVADACAGECTPSGRWTRGDLHVHTIQSNDAQAPLAHVLEAAFEQYGLDWLALANHLRLSDRDHEGVAIPGGPLPFSRAVALYEVPAVAAMQMAGSYADKTIFSSVEWDMPTHEHFNVGIVGAAGEAEQVLRALNEFEYKFTNRDVSKFAPEDVALWGEHRWNATHFDALAAMRWLKAHYPESSYGLINHPSRYPDRYKVSDFREFNDLAPDIVFAFEGMVGNQMEPDRGGYASARIEANAHSRTYGGADSVIAKLGGVWDALLGEGRRVWNFGNSDFHFKTAQDKYSSGYFPGEYTKNYVWVDGDGMPAIVHGLRSGKAFSVYGDLISALDFTVTSASGQREEMGGELEVEGESKVRVTIRFKSELPSNYENPLGSGKAPGIIPMVDHVDLIVGDVSEKAAPGTPAYDSAANPTTRVLARFDASAFVMDREGYQTVSYETTLKRNQYFRLRGTNLAVDAPGETQAGEPLADDKTELEDHALRFNAINDRNFADLWFYSNPIFVKVRP